MTFIEAFLPQWNPHQPPPRRRSQPIVIPGRAFVSTESSARKETVLGVELAFDASMDRTYISLLKAWTVGTYVAGVGLTGELPGMTMTDLMLDSRLSCQRVFAVPQLSAGLMRRRRGKDRR